MEKNWNKLTENELIEKRQQRRGRLLRYTWCALVLLFTPYVVVWLSAVSVSLPNIKGFLNGEVKNLVALVFFLFLIFGLLCEIITQKKLMKTYRENLRRNLFKAPYTAPLDKILKILGFKLFGMGKRSRRLTGSISRTIANTWDKLGYKIEPDARHSVRKTYKLDEVVCIYKDEKHFPTTRYYEEAALFADFGCGIIEEKGGDFLAERRKIEEVLTQAFMLNPSEKLRLQKRLELPAYTSRSDLGWVIQHLIIKSGEESRALILKFVIAIVANDGIIQVKEQLILKEILDQLGLKPEYLTQLLSDLSLENGVTIEEDAAKTSLKRQETETWRLDMDKLSNVMLNTAEIHQTLQEIFTDEEEQDEDEYGEIEWDDDFYQVSLSVISQKVWTKADLSDIFKHSRSEFEEVYPTIGSFVDDLNDWAEEVYGDFLLLEEGNVYVLNEDVAALIESEEKENSNEFKE